MTWTKATCGAWKYDRILANLSQEDLAQALGWATEDVKKLEEEKTDTHLTQDMKEKLLGFFHYTEDHIQGK